MAGKTIVGTEKHERALRWMKNEVQSIKNRMGYTFPEAPGGTYEPALGNPVADGYLLQSTAAGVRSWQTLNQAAVAGLTTADSPAFVTVKCSGLTDGYIPYHVSDAAGLANSPLTVSGGYVYCGSRLYLNGTGQVFNITQAPTDPASGITAVSILTNPIYTATDPKSFYAFAVNNRPIINTGVSNNSTQAGAIYNVFRNYYQVGSDDSGTLTNLHAQRINYGHYDTNTSATPQTNFAYGLYILPYIKTGAIGTMADIVMAADSTGGSYTYRYGIRQLNSGWNYFGGNLGLGKDATGTPDGTFSLYVTVGTPPSNSHGNTFIMYGADIAAGNTAPHFRTENGSIIRLYRQAHLADEKTDYTTGDLDTEAEIIAAINATNTKINSVLAALENTGLLAVA
ncbi:MAG: hypothetical protein M0R74_10690 [Dehalococcoidia bacterium]|nr:hypothetical protein [Dehalococcoidia bacterium]